MANQIQGAMDKVIRELSDRSSLYVAAIISFIVLIMMVYYAGEVQLIQEVKFSFLPSGQLFFLAITLTISAVLVYFLGRHIYQLWFSHKQQIKEDALSLEISQSEYIEQLEQMLEKQAKTIKRQKEQLGVALKEVHDVNDNGQFAEKMKSLKNLVAGLSHELNNPVNVIGGVVTPILENIKELRQMSDEKQAESLLDEVTLLLGDLQRGANKVTRIVKNFSSIAPSNIRTDADFFDPSVVFAEIIKEWKDSNPDITLNSRISRGIELYANEDELKKTIGILLKNAQEAVKGNVNPSVQLRITQNARSTFILVTDNGVGICSEYQSKIFEPFFSTKDDSETGGLGLYTAYNIIKNHHGEIKAICDDDQTTFKVTIPRYVYKPIPEVTGSMDGVSTWSRN